MSPPRKPLGQKAIRRAASGRDDCVVDQLLSRPARLRTEVSTAGQGASGGDRRGHATAAGDRRVVLRRILRRSAPGGPVDRCNASGRPPRPTAHAPPGHTRERACLWTGRGRRAARLPGPRPRRARPVDRGRADAGEPGDFIHHEEPRLFGSDRSVARQAGAHILSTPSPFARAWPVDELFSHYVDRAWSGLALQSRAAVRPEDRSSPCLDTPAGLTWLESLVRRAA